MPTHLDGIRSISLAPYPPVFIASGQFEMTDGNVGEINSTDIYGISMTDGELAVLSYRPFSTFGFDVNRAVNVQVVWCPINGTTSQGVTWTVTYDNDTFESGVLTAPATALDTTIVEDAEDNTSYTMQKTAKGIIDAGSLTVDAPIAFKVVATTIDSGNDPGCWFMGLLLSQ